MKFVITPKVGKRQSPRALWDRTLLWLNEYLALDVHPRLEEPEEERELLPNGCRAPSSVLATLAVGALRTPTATAVLANRALTAAPQVIPSFAPGEQIADIYEVRDILDQGDTSTVYLAHHVHWNTDLIVKAPSPHLAAAPRAVQQQAFEAERWVAIGVHPNIAACYYVQSVEGVPLRIIEFVSGGNLRTFVQAGRSGDLRLALDLAIQICHGLAHAHSRGIAHGYLSPENVLLTPQGTPKLTDFGMHLAAVPSGDASTASPERTVRNEPDTLFTTWRLLRAPAYVAPERWQGVRTVDTQTDIFALGVCLYELFLGCPPYDSTGGPRTEPAAPVAEPALDGVYALLKRCVDWRPEWRPRSVDDVAGELAAIYESLFGNLSTTSDQSLEANEWNNRAVSYFYAGKPSEAEAAWEYALRADPSHLDTVFNLGMSRWRRGALADDGFVRQLEAATVQRDDRWKAHYLLALVHLERGARDTALALLEQAARARPRQAEIESALYKVQAQRPTTGSRPEVLGGHLGYVAAVDVSANGQLGISASHDHTSVVWDLAKGRRLHVLQGHRAPVSCVFLSADGQWALTGSDDRSMRLWDLTSGTCAQVIEGRGGHIVSACLSADRRYLLWAGHLSSEHVERVAVELWDTESGRRLRTFEGHASAVKTVALSADGRRAVTAGDDQAVRIWDANTGECLHVLKGHRHFVSSVRIDDDGTRVLSGSWDQTLRLWDTESGESIRTFTGHRALVTSVYLSRDRRWALSGSWDCTVRLWEIATGRCLRTFVGHTSLVTSVALSADNRTALSGSWDCTVRTWEVPASLEICRLHPSGADAPAL